MMVASMQVSGWLLLGMSLRASFVRGAASWAWQSQPVGATLGGHGCVEAGRQPL